jgi:hypothetical protein
MLYYAFGHTILSELLYDLRLKLESIFGANFFKKTQILGSISDSIKLSNDELNRSEYSLELPALLLRLNDIRPYDRLPVNPIFTRRETFNYGNMYYPLLFNETKNSGLVANLQYYMFDIDVIIVVESQFMLLDIKRYLENFFPPQIPIQYGEITSLIPMSKSLYNDLVTNSGWDFDNDTIYYIYRQTDYLTGGEKYFIPFVINPLIVNTSIQKEDKEKLSQNLTGRNYINFELRLFLPVNLFIAKNREIIRNITLHFEELIDSETSLTNYLPSGPYLISSELLKQYRYVGTIIARKDNISIDQNDNILTIEVFPPKKLKELYKDEILVLIPILMNKYISNKKNITPDTFFEETYDPETNLLTVKINLNDIQTRDLTIYNELQKIINGERRADLFIYV